MLLVPYDILLEEASRESAKYIEPHIGDAIFLHKESCVLWYQYLIQAAKVDGLYAEFGVYDGTSINQLSNVDSSIKWYGFDSFYGLEEDWNGGLFSKGHFSLNGNPPIVNENVELVIGRFQDTLVPFLDKHKKPFSLLIIDCDTYKSTKYILDTVTKNRLVKGTIVCFDEYFGYPGWKLNEFKAWQEFCKENDIKYQYIIVSNWAVAVKIL